MTIDDLKGEVDQRIETLQADMSGRFLQVDQRFEALQADMSRRFEGIADLISRGFARVDERFEAMNARFDTQANRLDRHAAYWQVGSRWSKRMEDWAERVDQTLETKDRQIAALLARIEKLEGRNGGAQ